MDSLDSGHQEHSVGAPRQRRRWRTRVAPLSMAVAAVVLVLDQLTKHWAVNALSDGREVPVFWTLQWNLAFNTGMAFSRGEGFGPIIAPLAILVVVVLVVMSARTKSRLARFSAGLLIGGALGNLVDRIFRGEGWLHGAVVDFIDMQWWPIFNIADMGVSVGAVLFAVSSMRAPSEPAESERAESEPGDRAADAPGGVSQ